jgi:hypothetical protein
MSIPKADFGEIKRRQGVSRTALNSTPIDEDAVRPTLTYNDPSQRYAIVNLANVGLIPKSPSPAFRVLGLFPTIEAASAYGSKIARFMSECNVYLVETNKWNLIPRSTDVTPSECLNKVESLLINYYKGLVLDKCEFDSRRSQNTSPKVEERVFNNPAYTVAVNELERRGITLESVISSELSIREATRREEVVRRVRAAKLAEAEAASSTANDSKDETKADTQPAAEQVDFNNPMVRADEVFPMLPDKQKFVVLSVTHDDSVITGSEPAYCIYGAFETEAEAKGYDYFVLRNNEPTHDTNCGEMGAWFYTEQVKTLEQYGLTTHRLDEQNRIMTWNRVSKSRKYDEMEGITVTADRVLDDSGNIVPLDAESKDAATLSESKDAATLSESKDAATLSESKDAATLSESKDSTDL